jgi:predicted transcriptional regulator
MLGENIKRLMKENGYTQKQLAMRAQCTESAISKYVNNEREPNIRILKNLSIALGVTVDELISERCCKSAANVVQAPEKTCSTCQCNKVCDHNKYGFENCGNYISADLVQRAEAAMEIVEDVKETLLDYHLQENKKYLKSLSKTKKQFEIETARYRAITDAIKFALETLNEIEDRYTEEETDGKRTDR